jgi:hypothetical protein
LLGANRSTYSLIDWLAAGGGLADTGAIRHASIQTLCRDCAERMDAAATARPLSTGCFVVLGFVAVIGVAVALLLLLTYAGVVPRFF